MIIKVTDITNYKCVAPSTGQASCIGPRCMGWVWEKTILTEPGNNDDFTNDSVTHGHCGLVK